MLKSMTGYGRVKVENELREITVELRSVNHRYLDLNIKVPRIYGYLEDVVSKQAQAAIARGKVDIFVSVRAKEGADIKVTPNMAVIQGYMDALKKVSETYDIPADVTALWSRTRRRPTPTSSRPRFLPFWLRRWKNITPCGKRKAHGWWKTWSIAPV